MGNFVHLDTTLSKIEANGQNLLPQPRVGNFGIEAGETYAFED